MNFSKTITHGCAAVMLMACSTSPDKISASYVSPIVYQSYSCDQLVMEMARIQRKVNEVTGAQQKESTKDKWAMGVGLVVFWPALFFLIGDDKKEELKQLKGEYEAVEQAMIQKNCKAEMAKES